MRRGDRAWTDDEMVLLADLVVAGASVAQIAGSLRRTESAIGNRASLILCPVDGHLPRWGARRYGERMYWTPERCLDGLRCAMIEIDGPLPASTDDYNALKKGRLWPTSHAVLVLFHSMPAAWLAAGAPAERIHVKSRRWTKAEVTFLLEHAGSVKLTDIAKRLNRTYPAVRARLGSKGMGLKARENQGYLTAAIAARELGLPYSTVFDLLAAQLLRGRYSKRMHRWYIDPAEIARLRKENLMKFVVRRVGDAPTRRSPGALKWVALEASLDKLGAGECILIEPDVDDGPHWHRGLGPLAKRRALELRKDGGRIWLLPKAS